MRVSNVVAAENKKIKSKIRSAYDMGPINCFLKIFALDCKKPKTSYSLLKTIFMGTTVGILNGYTLYYKIHNVYSVIGVSVRLTDLIQSIYDYCQYIVDLYFVYKYVREISLEYFKQYETIDKILDVPYDSKLKRRLLKLIIIFFFIWLTSTMCDFIAWFISYEWRIPVVFSLSYLFLLIKIVTTLDLTSQVIQIEYRLRAIADLIQECYMSTEYLPTSNSDSTGDSLCSKNWFYSNAGTSQQSHHCNKQSFDVCLKVKMISKCYLLLTEQCTFISNMYGIRIVLNSLSLLIDMVRFTNIAVRISIGSQETPYYSGYFPAVSSTVRMLTCAAVLTSLVHHCEQAYQWSNRLLSVLNHLLINKHPHEELRSAATELQALVQSRPVSFDMANFFQLNYPFLVSTASVFVTYTIILLQSLN